MVIWEYSNVSDRDDQMIDSPGSIEWRTVTSQEVSP
jgi:hypothetical protein